MFAEIGKICYNVNKKFSKRKDDYCKNAQKGRENEKVDRHH